MQFYYGFYDTFYLFRHEIEYTELHSKQTIKGKIYDPIATILRALECAIRRIVI